MLSTDSGRTWKDISKGLPDRFISSIAVDRSKSTTAFITVSGFKSGHIFKTTDGGATWIDISSDLPDIPLNALLIGPAPQNWLHVGTDIGVFRSRTGGNQWERIDNGMPHAMVKAFAVSPEGRILAATYGRGVYVLIEGKR